MGFLVLWFFGPKPSFFYEKVGFLVQSHYFFGKRLVTPPKTKFVLGKNQKKNIFLEFGRIVSQFFLFFFGFS